MKRTSRVVVAIWVLLGVFMLTLFDSQFGGLRFISPHTGWLFCFATGLPVVCVGLLGFLPRSRARAWAFACLIPAGLLCLAVGPLFILIQSMTLFTRQASVHLGHSEIVTYFTDAGAWDHGGTIVQQEITVLPGLLWVKPLSSKNYMRDVSITVRDRHHVQCTYAADKYHFADGSPAQQEDVWVF